jgi:Na+-translocating ferredoxin:NAD+ oxidoreductase RnfD subunit
MEMPDRLAVSPAPFVKGPETVSTMMLDVIIALLPAFLWGMYVFGFRAAAIVLVSVGSAVLSEAVVRFLLRRPVTIGDLSAVVTGLLLLGLGWLLEKGRRHLVKSVKEAQSSTL